MRTNDNLSHCPPRQSLVRLVAAILPHSAKNRKTLQKPLAFVRSSSVNGGAVVVTAVALTTNAASKS